MILTGPAIEAALASGAVVCEGGPALRVGPNSLDLHLGSTLLMYRRTLLERLLRAPLDPRRSPEERLVELPPGRDGGWVLRPGRVYLGTTLEVVGTAPDSGLVPYLDGRSTLARLGVSAHLAAGRGDVGFVGRWTVEFVAHEPVRLRAGDRLFQMTFHRTEGEPRPYGGAYAGRARPVGPVSGVGATCR